MDVTTELLPEHPIRMLRATETDSPAGIHNGEILAYRCEECGAADEDVMEIIHDEDCLLAGQTAPTSYADRRRDVASVPGREPVRADGGER